MLKSGVAQKRKEDNKKKRRLEGLAKDDEEDTEEDEEMKGKTIEEKLAILEKSDESDLERIRASKTKGPMFSNDVWKLLVGLVGSGIDLALVFITL